MTDRDNPPKPRSKRQERVLLTVSGSIPATLDDDVAAGRRPRADYRVIQERVGADLLDAAEALRQTGVVGRLLERVGGVGALIAWAAFRRRREYDAVLTDGEQVGIPFAVMCRLRGGDRPFHAMIVHIVTTPSKERLVKLFRLGPMIERWMTYCTAQSEAITERFGVGDDRVVQIPFMVDTEFFAPAARPDRSRPLICAVGLERRDYPTLMKAVSGLDVDVVVAAASPWSKQKDSSAGEEIPANVTVQSYSQAELRDLYQQSSFTVMPLFEVEFQAGITAMLESMSMARAVVCTRSTGQTDTIIDGETGIYVRPGDVAEMRSAITSALDDPGDTDRLGEAARQWCVAVADVEVYADHFRDVLLRGDVATQSVD